MPVLQASESSIIGPHWEALKERLLEQDETLQAAVYLLLWVPAEPWTPVGTRWWKQNRALLQDQAEALMA